MPTYEFECECSKRWEQILPITSEPIQPCPKCGRQVRRSVGGGSGIIFKAAGFPGNDMKQLASLGRWEHRVDQE